MELNPPPLSRRSSVAAIVTHYHCEPWLTGCLESLHSQTHPLDAIIVIDDASGDPPSEIVSRFPAATLLESECNSGPYALIQAAIDYAAFDAYLHQDADDWSSPNRLEVQLEEAERTGAELVGCNVVRVLSGQDDKQEERRYPEDANATLAKHPFKLALPHPASIVGADLVRRLGGFATGLRFGGDQEFAIRAARLAKVRNAQKFCYFHRLRQGALTSSPETGLGSPARRSLIRKVQKWYKAMAKTESAGPWPPVERAEPVALRHLSGPRLD